MELLLARFAEAHVVLMSLMVVLAQSPELTPELLQQAVRESDVVVTGALTRIEEAKLAKSDGSPFKRATVVPTSVLKGNAKKGKAITFLILVSDDPAYGYAPKLKVGQKAVWVLTRGQGLVKELTALDDTAVRPLETEKDVTAMLSAAACPAKPPSGRCVEQGARCPYASEACQCSAACTGGVESREAPVLSWVCRPLACETATDGAKCSPDGLSCPGCYGLAAFTCARGKWVEHRISPPP